MTYWYEDFLSAGGFFAENNVFFAELLIYWYNLFLCYNIQRKWIFVNWKIIFRLNPFVMN